jgi:hypothetical protein
MRFSRVNHPFSHSYPIMNPPISQNIPIDYSGWCFGFREFWMTFQKPLGISASNASELSMILKRGVGEKPPTSYELINELLASIWPMCFFAHVDYTFFFVSFPARHRPEKIGWGFKPTWSWPLQRRPWNESSSGKNRWKDISKKLENMKKLAVTKFPNPHRIHGAGIYANIKVVYWWDPCYHI